MNTIVSDTSARERIARIVEPSAWHAYDATLRPFMENRGAHQAESWHVRAYQDGCRSADDARAWWFGGCKSVQPVQMFLFLESLAKADAILASLPSLSGEWEPIETAPKDGTLLELVVDYSSDDAHHPLQDAIQACTIGFNGLEDTGEDEWKFAGWCWSHDHFTEGKGKPIAWRPSRLNACDDGLPPLPAEPPVAPECANSPSGRHQVDTSMESGPNNCFFCEKAMLSATLSFDGERG